ncbi:conjugal transfer protein TrbL family protein [Micromonospora sp. WMMD558]|uniref:conjugal transfer protein TrbL family protein n=1 Tax=Micromonospora sp. WMMD558 TaxID=3403462 RepID=UPI003BF5A311
MGGWLADQIIGPILTWFAEMVIGALNALWDLLSVTAFVSPDVTELPQVTAFASTSLGIVNVCYVLAFLWTAILVMGRDTIQSQVGPGELIPRLVIGLIAANFAIPLCSTVIGLANAFTAALTSQDITAPGSMHQLRATTVSALNGQTGATAVSFLLLLIGLLIAVLTGILLVQWIIRLGVLVVAVGISPIALALHGTPQTEGAAKLWWRTILGTLGTVVIQAVALHTTLRVFLNPDSNLRVLGLPIPGGEPAAVMNLLIVVCLLWGVVKIPGLMRCYITQTRPNAMGMILRVVLVQQLTRGISRAFSGGRSATGAAGRAGRAGGGASAGGANRPWPVN